MRQAEKQADCVLKECVCEADIAALGGMVCLFLLDMRRTPESWQW